MISNYPSEKRKLKFIQVCQRIVAEGNPSAWPGEEQLEHNVDFEWVWQSQRFEVNLKRAKCKYEGKIREVTGIKEKNAGRTIKFTLNSMKLKTITFTKNV